VFPDWKGHMDTGPDNYTFDIYLGHIYLYVERTKFLEAGQ